jgi:hypothetical protein
MPDRLGRFSAPNNTRVFRLGFGFGVGAFSPGLVLAAKGGQSMARHLTGGKKLLQSGEQMLNFRVFLAAWLAESRSSQRYMNGRKSLPGFG